MDLTKGKNKRSVPIRYEQSQQTKYLSSAKNSHHQNLRQRKMSSKNNDNLQIDDNQSNQQYMQSSYLQKYSENQIISQENDQVSYEQQDFQEDKKKQYNFQASIKSQQKSSINHYELTFKKNPQQNQENINFYQENSKIYNEKSEDNYFQDDSQSYQQVQYGIQNQKETQKNQLSFNDLENLIDNRQKLYQKYHSALINFYYLHSKQTKTIEEKHKEYLLSLLIHQLHKNIFINGLKLNFRRLKGKKQQQKKISKDELNTKTKPQIKQKLSIEKLKKETQSFRKKQQKSLDESQLQEVKAKLLIFQQITCGIMRKKLFECFDSIVTVASTRKEKKLKESEKIQAQSQYSEEENQSQDNKQSIRSKKSNSRQPSSLKSKIHQLQPYNRSNTNNLDDDLQGQSEADQNQYNENGDEDGEQNEDDQENEGSFAQEMQEEQHRKLQQLIMYIHQLKNQALQTQSQLKRYFLKWKIYMLELILEQYHQQQEYQQESQNIYQKSQQNGSQNFDQQEEEKENQNLEQSASKNYEENQVQLLYTTNHNRKKRQTQKVKNQKLTENNKNSSYISTPISQLTDRDRLLQPSSKRPSQYQSHLTSQLDQDTQIYHNSKFQQENQTQNSIQQKTLILKSLRYEKYLHQFWELFSQFSTEKKLLIVSQKLRQQNLKKNVLLGFLKNIQWKQKQRAMTEYYQNVAQEQNLSQNRTAELFYKTNLKTKYFFEFIKTCKEVKCLKKLDSLTVKLSFLKIFSFSDSIKKKQSNIQRFLLTQKNKRLFKSFRGWKQTTILSPDYLKIKSFCQKRNTQLVGQYFSILQLIYKQSLVQQKKAFNFYKTKQTQKVFKYLHFLSIEQRENKLKQRELKQYLIFSKGKQFWQCFQEFYGEKVLQHRMKIRAQKLFYAKQKEFIFERLQDWRNFIIKKQSYRAIEYRLVKLRQKEVKENIFSIWLDELDRRMNKKDELEQSAQHKDWLVRYYGSLCDIATSGKISN